MDDDFIDVNDYIKETDIYQIQIDDKVNIKKIGKSKTTDNIIICENIGKDKNISIFSVVYSLNELNDCEKTGGYYDLLKLYQKNNYNDVSSELNLNIDDGNDILSELCVNIDEKYNIDDKGCSDITKFRVYFISQINNKENKYIKKIENINKNNILDVFIMEHVNMLSNKEIN